MIGTTFGFADGDLGAADGQSVDGNYGFVTYHPGDYIVGVDIPVDPVLGHPLYKVRTEDPINVFTGDVYVPQGADLTGMTFTDFLKANRYDGSPQVPATGLREPASTSGPYPNALCVGPMATVDADPSNPDLKNVGGSPYEGLQTPSCQYKLIHVEAGQSVAPNFNLWTDVPIPAKFYGYVTDDVSVSTDRRSTMLGEVAGVGNVPVGLYDWTNRLLTTVDSDPNGLFEVLMPSTNSYNCPVPAGPCAGMFRFVGNDPGQPQRPNINYNPAYRTIAANFQSWPGVFTSADTAPTRTTIQIEGPGSQFSATAVCRADPLTEPQLFRVDWPYAPNPNNFNASNNETTATINVYGVALAATKGSLTLTNDAGTVTTFTGASLPTWSDTQVALDVPVVEPRGRGVSAPCPAEQRLEHRQRRNRPRAQGAVHHGGGEPNHPRDGQRWHDAHHLAAASPRGHVVLARRCWLAHHGRRHSPGHCHLVLRQRDAGEAVEHRTERPRPADDRA